MGDLLERLLAEQAKSAYRLRFTENLELLYRSDLRKLLRMSRAILFMGLGLAFALTPFQETSLFNAPVEMRGGLLLFAQTVTPICLAAAALTFLRAPGFLTQGFQTAAVLLVLVAVLALRFFDLVSSFHFPIGLVGAAAIAIAIFGGFNWYLLCVSLVGFFTVAILQEYTWTFSGEPSSLQAYQLLIAFIISMAGSLTNEILRRQNWLQRESANALSRVDMLTGLSNRSDFERRMQVTLRQARRDKRVLVLMMMDIDHFKKINDRHGHAIGDLALRAVGSAITENCALRPLDVKARTGGEEFNVVWYDVSPEAVPALADKVLNMVRDLRIPLGRGAAPLMLSASLGVCWVVPGEATALEDLVRYADELMYKAKDAGRDRAFVEPYAPKMGSE